MLKHLNYNFISQGETTRVIGIALDADGLIKKQLNNYPTTGGEQVAWNVGGGNVYNSSVQKYAGNDSHRAPAAIVACSIESFRRRLRIPEVLDGLARGLQRIVSDEFTFVPAHRAPTYPTSSALPENCSRKRQNVN